MTEPTASLDAPVPQPAVGTSRPAATEAADRLLGAARPRTALGACLAAVDRVAIETLVALVRVYQWTLSPIVGRQCRFQPTCSHYFIGAVRKYGAARGTWRGLARIGRCHPWHPGGYDPP